MFLKRFRRLGWTIEFQKQMGMLIERLFGGLPFAKGGKIKPIELKELIRVTDRIGFGQLEVPGQKNFTQYLLSEVSRLSVGLGSRKLRKVLFHKLSASTQDVRPATQLVGPANYPSLKSYRILGIWL